MNETRTDICTRITDRIVADLEQGVRPWHRPWSVEHTAGRITRPLRHNSIPYQGINVVMLWSASVTKGYARPVADLQAGARRGRPRQEGRAGELVVYADRIRRSETNEKGGETEREIPFLKGYTVFNAEQCEDLPSHYYARLELPALPAAQRIEAADRFFACVSASNLDPSAFRPSH